jgi:hypothetical protein
MKVAVFWVDVLRNLLSEVPAAFITRAISRNNSEVSHLHLIS